MKTKTVLVIIQITTLTLFLIVFLDGHAHQGRHDEIGGHHSSTTGVYHYHDPISDDPEKFLKDSLVDSDTFSDIRTYYSSMQNLSDKVMRLFILVTGVNTRLFLALGENSERVRKGEIGTKMK